MAADCDRLPLEDALEDTPQLRSLVGVFDQNTQGVREYVQTLRSCCERLVSAQNQVTSATRDLALHLRSYGTKDMPLEHEDSILCSTLSQFATTIDEVSSWHQILSTQLADTMLYPVRRYIDADLQEIKTMGDLYQNALADTEKAYAQYAKVTKKKDSETELLETSEDLAQCRKKFHHSSLQYFTKMNLLQQSKKTTLIEPMLGYLHGMRSFFGLGHESLCIPEQADFIANITASVNAVHEEYNKESKANHELTENLISCSSAIYNVTANATTFSDPMLTHKQGYLFQKTKIMGLVSQWDRAYYFTQGNYLMVVARGDLAGALLIDLDSTTKVLPLENEERRCVFQVYNSKKSVVLQALNDEEREEWLIVLGNLAGPGSRDVKEKEKRSLLQRASSQTGSTTSNSSSTAPPPVKSQQSSSSLFSGMSNYITGKFQAAQEAFSPTKTHPDPGKDLFGRTPIVFDLISPGKEEKLIVDGEEVKPKRVNPFDQQKTGDDLKSSGALFHEVFTARFQGSMDVPADRGHKLVSEVARQIMAARAIHNLLKMTEVHLVVSDSNLMLVDPVTHIVRLQFNLVDVAFWSTHSENERIFGFITRRDHDSPSFTCHIFECNNSGEEVATALSSATKIAYQEKLKESSSQTERSKETELLLQNLALLEEKDDEPFVTTEGTLVLHQPESSAEPSPSTQTHNESEA